jgi:hypothetical protein
MQWIAKQGISLTNFFGSKSAKVSLSESSNG